VQKMLEFRYIVLGILIRIKAYEIIEKPIQYCDIKTHKLKRLSLQNNDLLVQMLKTSRQNNLLY
ncbi:hypothetical protein, partial [Candidatus Parabeggiatoa sp. HSG14]|uniref:hypothetical protein n=1 Tax=Candidatus Parabeggiatoa sp. HSG14 TaxID=3055593 RepID=UPI0025A7DB6C|nr:hypothetical protein [Thiotrichales bacterium HSG14]